jgi:UDP-N-acetylglucosamine--N-acetylmuramyl-(pentapeptide) pyrophosphoryl-undecaprenol N-acetylglucosamine transferase
MKTDALHIAFAGGGTGGHLFPGLAVAQRLAAAIPRLRVSFCGSGKAFERDHVSQAGFEYFALPSRPLPHGAREAVAFVVANLTGYLAAGRFLRENRVAAVVGLGGYASVPLATAATRCGVPLVLLEQNVTPGKATRYLARRASLVCTAFTQTASLLRRRCPVRATGNPIRPGFAAGKRVPPPLPQNPATLATTDAVSYDLHWPAAELPADPHRRVLVLGGSSGAHSLNESVPRALHQVRPQLTGWRIVHQSGHADLDATRALYAKLALEAAVVPFINDMPQTLAATDLAICRAGGTTLAELAAAGVPAVLLPYPHAADDHQAANARHFASAGGCVTIDSRAAPDRLDARLADAVHRVLTDERLRRRMSAAMCDLARPNAADDVAELIWSTVTSRSHRAAPAA